MPRLSGKKTKKIFHSNHNYSHKVQPQEINKQKAFWKKSPLQPQQSPQLNYNNSNNGTTKRMKIRRKSQQNMKKRMMQFDFTSPIPGQQTQQQQQLSQGKIINNSMPSTCHSTKVIDAIPTKKSSDEDIKKLLTEYKNKSKHYREYKQLSYADMIYQLGDDVLVKNNDGNNDYIGKIRMIILIITEQQEVIPIVQLQWYYKKEELTLTLQYDFISENEVFLTQHLDYIPATCLNGHCSILSLSQYDNSSQINSSNTFFSRAKYDIKRQRLDPGVQKWECHCSCQKPINPDLQYVDCDVCGEWYHVGCARVEVEGRREVEFVCWRCQKKAL